jgi:hypothetical protein
MRRLAAPLATAVAGLTAVAALALRDPHQAGAWGWCPLLWLTGTHCPFCGGLRAVNDLTHGNVAAALGSNALVVLAIPVAVGLWLRWLRTCWREGSQPAQPPIAARVIPIGLGTFLLFGLVRLLPGLEFLLP